MKMINSLEKDIVEVPGNLNVAEIGEMGGCDVSIHIGVGGLFPRTLDSEISRVRLSIGHVDARDEQTSTGFFFRSTLFFYRRAALQQPRSFLPLHEAVAFRTAFIISYPGQMGGNTFEAS